jgi:hypothetical protein
LKVGWCCGICRFDRALVYVRQAEQIMTRCMTTCEAR